MEFLVDSINAEGLILGRNGHRDIPVGTEFTAISRRRIHKAANGYRTEDFGKTGRIALTLREVRWYQRSMNHVPRGHTAGLAVTGVGLALLSELLRNLPRHEYLSLVAEECQDAEPAASKGGQQFNP